MRLSKFFVPIFWEQNSLFSLPNPKLKMSDFKFFLSMCTTRTEKKFLVGPCTTRTEKFLVLVIQRQKKIPKIANLLKLKIIYFQSRPFFGYLDKNSISQNIAKNVSTL